MVADASLKRAITAIKGGDKETGKRLLANFLHSDPRNVAAWLWLAQAVDDDAQKRDCYSRVLRIEPGNKLARDGMRRLDAHNRSTPPPRQKWKGRSIPVQWSVRVLLLVMGLQERLPWKKSICLLMM